MSNPLGPYVLPTHCAECGVYLEGGATVHKATCSLYPLTYRGHTTPATPSAALPQLTDATVRASVIAHGIRLGDCPPVGATVQFSMQLKHAETLESEQWDPVGPKQRVEFIVTQADIDAGRALINAQQATYKEPKTTTIPLAYPGPPPEPEPEQ